MQCASTALWNVEHRPHRSQCAYFGFMGRLQRRLDARPHPESLSIQDGEGTLHGSDVRREGEGWANSLHKDDFARLGWLLSARCAGRSWLRVDLGSHSSSDGLVGAHAGVSEAHGSNDVPRGGEQFAAMERLVL